MNELIKHDFNGVQVAFQGKEQISLTDLWKASGKDENKAPKYWRRNEGQAFIKALVGVLNVTENHLIKTTRGKNGGTWAHWQIALAYAKYLSPELHIWCNQVVRERLEEEHNPELGIKRSRERAIKSWRRQGKDDQWIEARLKGSRHAKYSLAYLPGMA